MVPKARWLLAQCLWLWYHTLSTLHCLCLVQQKKYSARHTTGQHLHWTRSERLFRVLRYSSSCWSLGCELLSHSVINGAQDTNTQSLDHASSLTYHIDIGEKEKAHQMFQALWPLTSRISIKRPSCFPVGKNLTMTKPTHQLFVNLNNRDGVEASTASSVRLSVLLAPCQVGTTAYTHKPEAFSSRVPYRWCHRWHHSPVLAQWRLPSGWFCMERTFHLGRCSSEWQGESQIHRRC